MAYTAYSPVGFQNGWCHVKLLPVRRTFCVRNHAPVYMAIESRIRRVQVCLAVTCHLHFWQNDRDLLRATAVEPTQPKQESAQKVDPGAEDFPAVPSGNYTYTNMTTLVFECEMTKSLVFGDSRFTLCI